MPHMRDYGGNAGGRKSKLRVDHGDGTGMVSMRCCNCDKLNYVHAKALNRAASPRCNDCGGALEEIDVSRQRRGLQKKKHVSAPIRAKRERCRACGRPVDGHGRLSLHLKTSVDCLHYYHDEDYVTVAEGHEIIDGTFEVQRDSQKFRVIGLNPKGDEVSLMRKTTKINCFAFIAGVTGEFE